MKMFELRYGLDAPALLKKMLLIVIGLGILEIIVFYGIAAGMLKYLLLGIITIALLSCAFPIFTILLGTLFFKFKVRDELIQLIPWKGNEKVLDVGCGRGLLLIATAKKLTTGKVTGIDIWHCGDQTKNNREAVLDNVRDEGVLDKVEIVTADIRDMPFPNAYFDVIVSSWVIHNINSEIERQKALSELVRVLKPGGYLAIVDIEHTQEYYDFLIKHTIIEIKTIGSRYTFGIPSFIIFGKK